MPGEYQIIFVIVSHPVLGYIVEAYRIQILKNGQWSVDVKKIIDFSSRFLNFEINDIEKQLLEMAQITREENVISHFHLLKERKPAQNGTYFSDQSISKYLIPFVSKHTAIIIDKLLEHDIPIYFKNGDKGIISEQPLEIEWDDAEPRFNFCLNETSFTYTLEAFHKDKKLQLSDAEIITQSPCNIKVNNILYFLPGDFDGQLLKPFLKNPVIHIPKEKVNVYLQSFVSKIIKKYRAEVSGFTVEDVFPEMKPSISITKLHKKQPSIELVFDYESELFHAHASQKFILKLYYEGHNISFKKIFRNQQAEEQIMQEISKLGFRMLQPGYFTCGNGYPAKHEVTIPMLLNEISKKSDLFSALGVTINIEIDQKKYFLQEPTITTTIKNNNDWFDLQISVRFGEFLIPFQKIIPNIIKGNNEFVLPDGSIAILPEEWFSRYKDISLLTVQYENGLKVHHSQLNLLENFEDAATNSISQKLKQLLKQDIPESPLPEMLKATLREYQQKGFEWLRYLHECRLGGCLADDMGLGKTIQALSYLLCFNGNGANKGHETEQTSEQLCLFNDRITSRKQNTHLIVAPLSLLHNWKEECEKFAPNLTILMYSGPDRYRLYHDFQYADIVLTSYGIVRNDADVLKHFDFHTIILDESQFIKNPESKSYDALMTLSSTQRFVLTGTPLENSLTDIWTQMNFLNPGMLGSLKTFKDSYVIPVERNNDSIIAQRVQKLISPFILRRTKAEVTPELPALTQMHCYCTMTDEQKSIYERKKSEIRNYLIENQGIANRGKRNIIVLSGLMKLRLIANHPLLTDPHYKGGSGKFEEICTHIDRVLAEGHKVIVFSQFIKHLNIFREHFDSQQIRYEVLTGQTSQKDRQKNINNFKCNAEIRLFLMTLKAGGVGLNLTQADYVFVLDPWWNPASENQAINRTHRIGQDKKIFAYKFISTETIEEKIMLLQQKKSDLFYNIIGSGAFSKLSEEELLTLFD
jgi:superfamily II DNA or RNA helicase